jgi:hypothetical protein
MPEGMNGGIAHKLAESEDKSSKSRREELTEIAEAVVLALVAVATAWSGWTCRTSRSGPQSCWRSPNHFLAYNGMVG